MLSKEAFLSVLLVLYTASMKKDYFDKIQKNVSNKLDLKIKKPFVKLKIEIQHLESIAA